MRMFNANEFFGILVLALVFSQTSRVGPTRELQPVKVNLKILSQRYCRGESSVSFPTIQLTLQLEVLNVTNKTLIVQKDIGRAWYREIVARNERTLGEGEYEYNPEIEFAPTKSHEEIPPTNAPSSDFIILAPGKSFAAESHVDIPTRTGALSSLNKGLIQEGNHVLQLQLATWTFLFSPATFRKSWQRYGDLVSQEVKSEPVHGELLI